MRRILTFYIILFLLCGIYLKKLLVMQQVITHLDAPQNEQIGELGITISSKANLGKTTVTLKNETVEIFNQKRYRQNGLYPTE